jgi:hypothetical protein
MRLVVAVLAGVLAAGLASAQTSASYRLEEHVFNAGGHPEAGTILTSAGYRLTLDALGESLVGIGLGSGSYHMDGSFGAGYPPPDEVTGLRFTDTTTLVWDPEKSVGTYMLYRDWVSALSGMGYGQCQQQDLTDEIATDSDTPTPPGGGYFYLVTVENRLSEEGTKGWHDGVEREGNACP